MTEKEILLLAKERRRHPIRQRYAYYEAYKRELQALQLAPEKYGKAIRSLADALNI